MTSLGWIVLASDGFDVSVPETTQTQWAIGVVGVCLLLVGLLILRHRMTYWGLSDDQRAIRADARLALLRRTPALLQVHSYDFREEGWTGEEPSLEAAIEERLARVEDGADDLGRVDSRAAIDQLRQTLGLAWRERIEHVPGAALTAFRWAALVAVFGAVAVSTGAIVSLLSASPESPSLSTYVDTVMTAVANGADAAVHTLGAFPYAGFLWALAFTLAFQTGRWLFEHWYVVAGLLAAGGVAVWVGERGVDEGERPDTFVERPRWLVGAGIAWLAVVWGVGTAVSRLGAVAGAPALADLVGFVLAVMTAVAIPVLLARSDGAFPLRGTGWSHDLAAASREGLAVVAGKRLLTLLSGGAGLLVLAYTFVGVFQGRFLRVGTAFLAAEPSVKGAVLVAILGVGALAVWVVRDALPTARTVLRRIGTQQMARLQVAAAGLPVVAVGGVYIVVSSITKDIVLGLVAAIVAGVVLRKLMQAGLRFAHGVDWAALATPPPIPLIVTRCWALTPHDNGGRPADRQYVTEVNGRRLASHDREALASATADAIRALTESDQPDPSVPSFHAEFLVERGIHDAEDIREKLEERVRKTTFTFLRSNGPEVSRDHFDRKLEKFPDAVVEDRLAELERANFIYRDQHVVALREDPYRDDGQALDDVLRRAGMQR